MRQQALFINGIFESVAEEILKVQSVLPEQIPTFISFEAGSVESGPHAGFALRL